MSEKERKKQHRISQVAAANMKFMAFWFDLHDLFIVLNSCVVDKIK